jgi:L-seryl-tRNA(Ser) seleniumtransferase
MSTAYILAVILAGEMSDLLRGLPAVHALADAAAGLSAAPRWAVVEAARRAVAIRRAAVLAGTTRDVEVAAAEVAAAAERLSGRSLRRVINATGVVLHTNLGRAPLAPSAIEAISEVARGYSNLEYDLTGGSRGSRHDHLRELLLELTGAEAAIVVNNNAAACVLGLSALAGGREVIVSRGELVEIGGSFRIPDILRLSGCALIEVGTTNKTRMSDYERAVGPDTAMLLKVHRSNFAIVGFTEECDVAELVALARGRSLAAMVDLGSGAVLDAATQRELGLPVEPTVREVVAAGPDVVCFSGDKLLGGPQAGILVGGADAIKQLRAHPMMRALRPDKLTLAALEATLALYRDGAWRGVPALGMLDLSLAAVDARARRLVAAIGDHATLSIEVVDSIATVGGGAMPTAELKSRGLALRSEAGSSSDRIDAMLRAAPVPVIGRIEDGRVVLDARTIGDDEIEDVATAVRAL